MNTRWNGFLEFRYVDERTRAGEALIGRRRIGYNVQFSPSRFLSHIRVNGTAGGDIDFANARPAHGVTLNASATLHPDNHLELALLENQQRLDVDTALGNGRLFTERVSRAKATYTFTSRMFARVIAQYVSTARDAALYRSSVMPRSGDFSGSALFAYKINWQSVLFVGYGDDRERSDRDRLEPLDRQFFVKLSYAFQR